VLSLESFSRLYFSDGRDRPEFRQKLLDRGVTPEQIAWLEDEAAAEMQDGGGIWNSRSRSKHRTP
jgi:hypothetical protein